MLDEFSGCSAGIRASFALGLIAWSAACGASGEATPNTEVPTTSIPEPVALDDGPKKHWTKSLSDEHYWLDLELADGAVWVARTRGQRPDHGVTPKGRAVCTLDAADGEHRWCAQFDVEERPYDVGPGRLFVDPVGGVFVGAGAMVAISPEGKIVWNRTGLSEPNLIGVDDGALYVATGDETTSKIRRVLRKTGEDDATWTVPFVLADASQRDPTGAFFARTYEDHVPVIHALQLDAGSPPQTHEVIRHDASVRGAEVLRALLFDLHEEAVDIGEIRHREWIPWLRVDHGQWSYLKVTADDARSIQATGHAFEPDTPRGDIAFRSYMRHGVPFTLRRSVTGEGAPWVLERIAFEEEGWQLLLQSPKAWWAVRLAVGELGFAAVVTEGEQNVVTVVNPRGHMVARTTFEKETGDLEVRRGAVASLSSPNVGLPREIWYARPP